MPEVPPVSRSAGLNAGLNVTVEAVFADAGPLARGVDGYEPRPGQREMAMAVAAVLDDGGTLLAEAGTGTGKTLAYLIPSILSGHRVLVSTGTKNLQEQIFFKDLPALERILGRPFKATLMKGRTNYLCLHRFEIVRDGLDTGAAALIDTSDRVLLPMIGAWSKETETGDRAELSALPDDVALWKDIAADAETCLGAGCPRYDDCFVTKMRQRAAESDVVIVNHHLLCADAAVRRSEFGEVIPACATLVVDEAHQLEDVATQYFGVATSSYGVEGLVQDAARLLATRDGKEEEFRAVTRVSECARTFFAGLTMTLPAQSETRIRYSAESMTDHFEDGLLLAGALETLSAVLTPGAAQPGEVPGTLPDEARATLGRRAADLRTDLRFLTRANDADFVYYLETRGRGVFLRSSPIDVSRLVPEALFDRMRSIVLTSATLTVEGRFDYVRGRLGIREADEVRVASGFDYARQALLYLPKKMPPPKSPSFGEAAAREVIALLTRSEGRAFVLFTSYAVLRTVQPFVEMGLPYPILVQGTMPRQALIERFRRTPNAVLLATSSFWQGVDVVGEALSCVVIDKLPFASPGDPVTAARIEAISARGGDAFAEYQVPLAILTLQQGLGRLIRHRSDRGVLAILDPRLKTMGYGRRFLDSLPNAPVTHDLDAVGRFFAAGEPGGGAFV